MTAADVRDRLTRALRLDLIGPEPDQPQVDEILDRDVSDIGWQVFVHGNEDKCRRALWMEERGTSGDLTDITIRCGCSKSKALSAATKLNDVPLGYCNGPRPWLGDFARERCGSTGAGAKVQVNRLLVRSASNALFCANPFSDFDPRAGGRASAGR